MISSDEFFLSLFFYSAQYGVMKLAPEFIRINIAHRMNKKFRSEYYAQQTI